MVSREVSTSFLRALTASASRIESRWSECHSNNWARHQRCSRRSCQSTTAWRSDGAASDCQPPLSVELLQPGCLQLEVIDRLPQRVALLLLRPIANREQNRQHAHALVQRALGRRQADDFRISRRRGKTFSGEG